MRDFTLKKYDLLLQALQNARYVFLTFEEYCCQKKSSLPERFVILRHDVDLKAENSLKTALIEHNRGIRASYYFRVIPQSNKPQIIKEIVALGHEIGYHYEDMSIAQGDATKAIAHFEQKLAYFRTYYPVKTICMHGAPQSEFDGKELWKSYDYRKFGVEGEPYFDVDFSHLFYLTDTGRMWDGYNVSVRDKIPHYQDVWTAEGLVFHSSDDVISAIKQNRLPLCVMFTTHPQRWTDNLGEWTKEYVLQSLKNAVKYIFIKCRESK